MIVKNLKKKKTKKSLEELEVENRAVNYGAIGVLLLTLIFYILEIVLTGKTSNGFYALIAIFSGIIYLYRGIKLMRNSYIVLGILWFLLTGLCVYKYISDLIATSAIL